MSLKTVAALCATSVVVATSLVYFSRTSAEDSLPLSEDSLLSLFTDLFSRTQANVQRRIQEVQRENMKLQQVGQQLPEAAIMQFFKTSFEDDLRKTTQEAYGELGTSEEIVEKSVKLLEEGGEAYKMVQRLRDLWHNFSGEAKPEGSGAAADAPTKEELDGYTLEKCLEVTRVYMDALHDSMTEIIMAARAQGADTAKIMAMIQDPGPSGPAMTAETVLSEKHGVSPKLFQMGMQKFQNSQDLLKILMESQAKQQEIMRQTGLM